MKRYIMTTGLMCICVFCSLAQKQMMYGDTSRIVIPFSKDPHVVELQGKYLMYYSIPPKQNGKLPWKYDKELYKRKNTVERFFL